MKGLIANSAPDGDETDVDLIKNLVIKSISGSCIILLCINMRDDMENQSANGLARAADPAGDRTIGKFGLIYIFIISEKVLCR